MNSIKTIALFFLFSILGGGILSAQFRQAGQGSIALQAGAATKGYYIDLSYQKLLGNNGSAARLDADYTYTKQKVSSINKSMESDLLNLGSAYSYTFYDLFGETVLLQPYLGAFIGYEKNKIDKEYLDLITTKLNDGLNYGLYGGVELEFVLSHKVTLILNGSHYFSLKSKINENISKAGAGIKFYIN